MSIALSGHSRQLGRRASIHQLDSHAHLLDDVSDEFVLPGRSRRGRLDAIVVPASRPASALAGLIDLAARLDIMIVVLFSR